MSADFAALRHEVWGATVELPRAGLVTMHSGNASGVHRPSGLAVIKPSGVDYDGLRPVGADRVPDGVQTPLRPSVDTIHHVLRSQRVPHHSRAAAR